MTESVAKLEGQDCDLTVYANQIAQRCSSGMVNAA